jgi:hypothetical protein
MYIKSSPLVHPAQRSIIKSNELLTSSRVVLQSETLEDASKASLALLLVTGKGPTTLQRSFNNLCTTSISSFKKENPTYTFKRCGAKRKDEPVIPKGPKKPRGRPRKEV